MIKIKISTEVRMKCFTRKEKKVIIHNIQLRNYKQI